MSHDQASLLRTEFQKNTVRRMLHTRDTLLTTLATALNGYDIRALATVLPTHGTTLHIDNLTIRDIAPPYYTPERFSHLNALHKFMAEHDYEVVRMATQHHSLSISLTPDNKNWEIVTCAPRQPITYTTGNAQMLQFTIQDWLANQNNLDALTNALKRTHPHNTNHPFTL